MITKSEGSLPTISSVIILDGALPGNPVRQQYCDSQCGVTSESIGQILGGTEARMGAWPWNAGKFVSQILSEALFGSFSQLSITSLTDQT